MFGCSSTPSSISIIMLLTLFASRGGRGAMAFHNSFHANKMIHQKHAYSSAATATATTVASRYNRRTINSSARFMSSAQQQTNYNSMKVSELRDLLKENGLPVSGIKAQLVERLTDSNNIQPRAVADVPEDEDTTLDIKVVLQNPIEDDIAALVGQLQSDAEGEEKASTRRTIKNINKLPRQTKKINRVDNLFDDDEDEDLVGLVDKLKNMDAGPSGSSKTGAATSAPSNLVFAKENEHDDDEWYDVDDDEFEGGDSDGEEDEDVKQDAVDPNQTFGMPEYEVSEESPRNSRKSDVTFKEDFQGTRVFVQGLPEAANWQDLKDHFKVAGEVVFASVSIDRQTGQSKQCGIVQYETPAMAQNAIREMRNHPLDGAKLYVREDVQETRQGGGAMGRNDRSRPDSWGNERNDKPPQEWKRANDKNEDGGGDNWYNLKDEELKEIETLIEKRDRQRKQRNYHMSDKLREELKEEFGVHLDDRFKLWWTDTKHGGVPGLVSELKGEGGWGKQNPWRQIPTSPESDGMVDSNLVMDLLAKRDRARRRKDFDTADELLQKAHSSPEGGLGLRIHDESRTWRIWTDRPPPKRHETPRGYDENLSPDEVCTKIVMDNEPEKLDEMRALLRKFPGREWNIVNKLKDRYGIKD